MPNGDDFLRKLAQDLARDDEALYGEPIPSWRQNPFRVRREIPEREYPFLPKPEAPPEVPPIEEAPPEEPKESWWQRIMRYAPWSALGIEIMGYHKTMAQVREKHPELTPEVWEEYKRVGIEQERWRLPSVPSVEEYREFEQLPWYQQLMYEAPFWITTAVAPSAAGVKAWLGAKYSGAQIPRWASMLMKALTPVAAVETAPAKGVKKIAKGISATKFNRAFRASPEYKQLIKTMPKPSSGRGALEARLRQAFLYEMQGHPQTATNIYEQIWYSFPNLRPLGLRKPIPAKFSLVPIGGGEALLPMNPEKWALMNVPERVNLVTSLGLSGKLASKAWEVLTTAERTILTGEVAPILAPKVEAPTPPPVVKPPEVPIAPPEAIVPAVVEKPRPLLAQLKDLYSEINVEIKASQVAIKGLTGDEAKMARTTLAELERSLKNVNKAISAFKKEPGLPDATKLRQTIMTWAKYKGLPQSQLRAIYKRATGTPQVRAGRTVIVGKGRLTTMTTPELQRVLAGVRRARPTRIKGKVVITSKTEGNIQSLKDGLIAERSLTPEAFTQIMKRLNLPVARYVNQYHFITESQGKELIRVMNDEAEVGYIKQMAEWQGGLDKNPNVASVVKEYEARIAGEGQVFFEGKPADASMLKDMRFFTEDLQTRTGKPFYHIYFLMNRQHQANRMIFNRIKMKQVKSTPEFRKIVNSKKSLDRINKYIGAKNKWLEVESPPDITAEEIKLANALEDELFELIPDYRFHRFLNFYKQYEGNIERIGTEIPDAPIADLRVAVNIYENKGAGALRAYLDTRTWGIVESGFEPHFTVNPRLAQRSLRTAFPTGRFKSRSGVEFYPADMNIVQRVDRYIQQMLSFNLRPYIRKMEQVYREAIPQLKKPDKVRAGLSMSANEMMGYVERGGPLYNLIMKFAGQAYATVFGTMPVLPFRNLFQNLAFHPDKTCLVDPRNRKLTQGDWEWYHTNISQMEAIPRDLLLAEEGGLPFLKRFNQFIYRLNIYGASDSKINRVLCNWGSINKAERALLAYEKDGNVQKFISSSGLAGLTSQQQVDILKILTVDKTRAVREIATEITNNVHFLYDRAQRAMIEMGGMGRVFGSLLIFPRSVAQRIFIQFKVLDPASWAPVAEKKRALKILLAMVLGSVAANKLFEMSTGRTRAPYNPLNILAWSPGGLALGSVTAITDVVTDIFLILSGDENAKTRLPGDIERAGDTMLPYYKLILSSLESALNMKYADRLLVRELRSMIEKKMQKMGFLDDAYEPNKEFYEAERNWEWKIKHAIFGTEPPALSPIEQATKELPDLEKQLGKFILAEDSDDGYTYEMIDFGADIRRLTRDIVLADITAERGFSDIVIMYRQAEYYWDTYYYSLPASDRVAFRENPSAISAWTEAYLFTWGKLSVLRNENSLAVVRGLVKKYNIPTKAIPAREEQRPVPSWRQNPFR